MTTPLNYYQAATSGEKLRGKYYTPPELVRLILETVRPGTDDLVLDPACGDGEFLVGAVRYLAEHAPASGRESLGWALARRLAGLEIHAEAAAAARERVAAALREGFGARVDPETLPIRQGNALKLPRREAVEALVGSGPFRRLCVVGNPPYVEAKRLPAEVKEGLRRDYPRVCSGAPDLYLYFLHVASGWLRGDDRLAFVLPNKVLVNVSGLGVRRGLLERGLLARIDFATRAGIFAATGVYPVVVYAGPESGPVALGRVERADGRLVRRELVPAPRALYAVTRARALFPTPAEPELAAALFGLLEGLEDGRLDDVLDIRWSVSFHRRGLRERFVTRERPASPHARRFLGGGAFSGNGEVRRYGLRWGGWWIDYDEARLRTEGNPLPPADLFAGPKVVICQNGRTLRAACDEEGHVLKDTFLCGVPRSTGHPLARRPRALVGLLGSATVHFFYAHVFYGGHVQGGYLHFLRSFLEDLPLGTWTDARAGEVEALAARREDADSDAERLALEAAVEKHVQQALGLDAAAGEAIREWAARDPNWQARERVRWREPGGAGG